jgi:hypothetical protein
MIAAILLKNNAATRPVAIARYNVWILCHMMVMFLYRSAKVGNFRGKNYIWKNLRL